MKLTDSVARSTKAPTERNEVRVHDSGHRDAIAGFGLRVTKGNARSWVFNYRHKPTGTERRLTLGSFPSWSADQAREEAKRLRRLVEQDRDPLAERQAAREAPGCGEMFDRYGEEHAPKKRTGEDDKRLIERWLRPVLGRIKVNDVDADHVATLHRQITAAGSPIAANRAVALLSKCFTLAITWQVVTEAGKHPWRAPERGNPCRGIERNAETKRNRYLEGDEMSRLLVALAARGDHPSANATRLAILTGARRGEILGATWDQFDLKAGRWVKPSSHTKQKREHRVPLSPAACQLLAEMKAAAEKRAKAARHDPSPYLFPAPGDDDTPQQQLKRFWASVTKAAGLQGVRFHDLRHQFASTIASAPGASLPLIGALLGHTQPSTTQRYAHLFDDPQRRAVEGVAATIEAHEGKRQSAEVVDHPAARR